MILLTSATDLVELVTGGSQALSVHTSYVDLLGSGASVNPQRQNTNVSSAATTTIIPSPSAGVQRAAKFISVFNTDPAAPCPIVIQHTDGTTVAELFSISLLAGNLLTYNDDDGWILFNGLGSRVEGVIGPTGITGSTGSTGATGPSYPNNAGISVIDFGGLPGVNQTSVVVPDATIDGSATIRAFFMTDSTSDHSSGDHTYAALFVSLTCSEPTPGVGFTVFATSQYYMQGTFNIRWEWSG